MRTKEWQTYLHLIQSGSSSFPATDVIQDEAFWEDLSEYAEVVAAIEVPWVRSAGSTFPSAVLEETDDPESDNWRVVWSNPTTGTSATDWEGTYFVTLSRQLPLNRPYRLRNVLRWRLTGFPADQESEIMFRIVLTCQ